MIQKAIQYALVAHDLQVRKGTIIPYIFHPIEVGTIIAKYDQDATHLICAGILHDTVEDTGTSVELLRKLFGNRVADLVQCETEDKTKSWLERKQATIDQLRTATDEIKIVACADKLSNMRDIEREYDQMGDAVFDKFNAGKDQLAWYYHNLIAGLASLADHTKFAPMYLELKGRVEAVSAG